MDETEAKRAAFTALAPARQRTYAFLSEAFHQPPSYEQLDLTHSDRFFRDLAGSSAQRLICALRDYAAQGPIAELQHQAYQEFTNLFRAPGQQFVTPYESVYRDAHEVGGRFIKGLLMGQSAVDVRKWYQLAGLTLPEEYQDLPDHICMELDCLARLCTKESKVASPDHQSDLTRAWEIERDFLAGHVVLWIPTLRDKIHQKSQNAYFRAVADMTVDFTGQDLASLEDLLGPSPGTSAPESDGAQA